MTKKCSKFAPRKSIARNRPYQGEMLEWLKRHAWKACNRLKRFPGSNPGLSAKGERCSLVIIKQNADLQQVSIFCFVIIALRLYSLLLKRTLHFMQSRCRIAMSLRAAIEDNNPHTLNNITIQVSNRYLRDKSSGVSCHRRYRYSHR